MDKEKSKGNLSTLTSWEEVYLDTFDDNFDFNLNLASHAFKASEFSSMELFDDNFDLNWDSDSHALNASMFSTRRREMHHHLKSSYNMDDTQSMDVHSHFAMAVK